jgi:hypothetical protein
MENSTFCTDLEITEYLNQELAELWARLTQNEGQPHLRAEVTFTVTKATSVQALPANFWRVQEVEATIEGYRQQLYPFMAGERAQLMNQATWGRLSNVQYRIQAGNIEFLPALDFTAYLYYTPAQVRLTLGNETFDGYNGYEMAAIHGTVATMKAKQDEDASFFERQKDRIYAQIDSLAGQRDGANPERVQDTVGLDVWPGLRGWIR